MLLLASKPNLVNTFSLAFVAGVKDEIYLVITCLGYNSRMVIHSPPLLTPEFKSQSDLKWEIW